MMEDTATLDEVDIRPSSFELNENVVLNLNPWHAMSGLKQADVPNWQAKLSGIRLQPAGNQRFPLHP